MEKVYNPDKIEKKWYQYWEEKELFSPDQQGSPAYCVMIAPPNVTGSLHMGHAFQQSIMDTLTRYHRMQGCKTLWQVGTDHAGIATQMVVERKLMTEEQKDRHALGRETFIEKIWEWKEQSGDTIMHQMRRLGNSVDWKTNRFTMDQGMNQAVYSAFIQLYEDGLIYRGKRLVNWDPKLGTAISDLEVENREQQGKIWYMQYPLKDGNKVGRDFITVATTRPETVWGDCAVAVHPGDARYADLIGCELVQPVTGRFIPIVGDDSVESDFGTGCVKITPAHDFNDYEMAKRHGLRLINILTKDAILMEKAQVFSLDGLPEEHVVVKIPERLVGLSREQARKETIKLYEELGYLEKVMDHTLMVPYGDRSGVVIEPLLTDQWFIKMKPLAEPAIKAVESGAIEFVPEQYSNMYFSWMSDIQDWCISRQLWWGHRIPAWYDDSGTVYVGETEASVRKRHQIASDTVLRQDEDVFDTWFSSALWTFSTLGWPEKTKDLACFHPTDVLVTGFDIIFFWVARMIMMSLYFVKDSQGRPQVPFRYIYMHGLIRDEQGQKMSKSKGNVLDPLDMIDGITLDALMEKRTKNMMQPQMAEKIAKRTRVQFPEGIAPHGADALRFTLYSLASTGRDLNWDMKRLEGYRNFCNKLWNASRYVLTHVSDQGIAGTMENLPCFGPIERWILSTLQRTIQTVRTSIDRFRFDLASQSLYNFVWNTYCDWYLEFSKPTLWMDDKDADQEKRVPVLFTLVTVLETILRLAHPFIPFITEEIWQKVSAVTKQSFKSSIMIASYPEAEEQYIDLKAEQEVVWLQEIITALRAIRREMRIEKNKTMDVFLRQDGEACHHRLDRHRLLIHKMVKSNIHLIETGAVLEDQHMVHIEGKIEILYPLSLVSEDEKKQEKERLEKSMLVLEEEIERVSTKLLNERFVSKAPPSVVDKEKDKLLGYQEKLSKIKDTLKQFL